MEILQQTFRMFAHTLLCGPHQRVYSRGFFSPVVLVCETRRAHKALHCLPHSLARSGNNSSRSSLARAEVS